MHGLVEKILAGDETSVRAFYLQYAPKIGSYLRKRLPKNEIQEILNDVFLDAIDEIATLREQTNLQAWLYKIAHNKIVDFYRKQKIKSFLFSQIPYLEIVAQEMSQPEFILEKDKIRDNIEASMKSISQKYRNILHMHYVEQMPIKTIALSLHLSPKATESLLFRARKHFMNAYERI